MSEKPLQPTSAADPAAVTVDAFLGGALTLRQPAHGYRAGLDAVLLAAACDAVPGATVVDCGAGIGTVGLCVARRIEGVGVTLVERAPVYAALARANIQDNGLAGRVTLIEADLTLPLSRAPPLAALIGRVDQAIANPPYGIDRCGTPATDPLKQAANAMPAEDLDAWIRCMAALVRPGGTMTMIHRADALAMLFAVIDRRFGALQVRPVHPRMNEPAHRILVRGTKGRRAPLALLPPLILHDAAGAFTPTVTAVLRNGAALDDCHWS